MKVLVVLSKEKVFNTLDCKSEEALAFFNLNRVFKCTHGYCIISD